MDRNCLLPGSKSQTKPADCARQSMAAFCASASMPIVFAARRQVEAALCAVGGRLYRGNQATRYYSVPLMTAGVADRTRGMEHYVEYPRFLARLRLFPA